MDAQEAIDLGREAIRACMMIGGPILIISLLVGLALGMMQAMTQVQDQTVSFVPKLLIVMVAIAVCLPWLSDRMLEFSHDVLSKPMMMAHSSATPTASVTEHSVSFVPVAWPGTQPAASIAPLPLHDQNNSPVWGEQDRPEAQTSFAVQVATLSILEEANRRSGGLIDGVIGDSVFADPSADDRVGDDGPAVGQSSDPVSISCRDGDRVEPSCAADDSQSRNAACSVIDQSV